MVADISCIPSWVTVLHMGMWGYVIMYACLSAGGADGVARSLCWWFMESWTLRTYFRYIQTHHPNLRTTPRLWGAHTLFMYYWKFKCNIYQKCSIYSNVGSMNVALCCCVETGPPVWHITSGLHQSDGSDAFWEEATWHLFQSGIFRPGKTIQSFFYQSS